ncbi:MAG: trypsin-like peptidase domain-containing protein [Fuerstiella sp.]
MRFVAVLLLTVPAFGDVTAIYFGASYCVPCRQLKPGLERMSHHFEVRRVDVGDVANLAIVQQYTVERLPTIVFLEDGKELDRIVGYDRRTEARATERLSGRDNWRPLRSAVRVRAGGGIGSGVILSSDVGNTIVLTAAHVVADVSSAVVEVFRDSGIERHTATIEVMNPESDAALLRITTNVQPLPSAIGADDAIVRPGDVVFTIGCSGGERPTSITSRVLTINNDGDVFCSGAPAQGRSGGGLFNRRFQLIGMCSAASQKQGDGWYVAASKIKALLSQWRPTQYRVRSRSSVVGVGMGIGVSTCGPCNNPNCPNCRPRPTTPQPGIPGPRGSQGFPGPAGRTGATGAQGPPGRDGSNRDLAGLIQRLEKLENAKRRVVLVDGKTRAVLDDETYGIDEPLVFDVQQLLQSAK